MGTWGTGLSSNDTFEDIYQEFFELYNKGLDIPAISQQILNDNKELQNDYEDQNSFWFLVLGSWWMEVVSCGRDLEVDYLVAL